MKDSPAVAAAAGLVLLGSLAALAWTFVGPGPAGDPRVQEEIGRTLAREAVKHLGAGRRLTVLTRDTTAFPQPAADQVLAAFTREAARSGATVAAVQRFEVDPLRPAQVPPGDFLELIRRSAAGDVLVSLLGPPLLGDDQRAQLPATPPCRIVAVCAGPFPDAAGLRQLAAQGLLQAAVVDRPQSRTAPPRSRSDRTFEQLYTVFEGGGTPGPGVSR
ncbi:MAG: hypothetical protein JNL10_02330 [Verrucomicrobiales bacterium]|nr:hypothetical protein [Verrucomicrobiales bacterium]